MIGTKNLLLMIGFLVQLIITILAFIYAIDNNRFLCDMRVLPPTSVVYEPLRINIQIKYIGTKPIKAIIPTGSHSLITIELINKSQNKQYKLKSYQLYTDAPVHEVPLPTRFINPGALVVFSLDCVYNWHKNEFLLSDPGVYEVILRCFIPIEEFGEVKMIEANTKTVITVKNYQGEDLDLWRRIPIYTIFTGKTLNDEQMKELTSLITRYPKSPYRPYALAILGGTFGRVSEEITIQQRITYLEQLIKEYPEFSYIDYSMTALCRMYANTGQSHKAKIIAELLIKDPWVPYTLKTIIRRLIETID